MKLHGKVIKETRVIKEATIEKNKEGILFRDLLEECFIELCRKLDISVPLWLNKNSTEFGAYRRTFFTQEQFVEKVSFDRFELKLEVM